MGLPLVERLVDGLQEDTGWGRLEEEAAAKVLDEAVAVAAAAWVSLQVFVLLSCLLLDPRASTSLGAIPGLT